MFTIYNFTINNCCIKYFFISQIIYKTYRNIYKYQLFIRHMEKNRKLIYI